MEWQDKKRYSVAESNDGQIDFYIRQNKQGRFYAEGYLAGGQKHRMPFENFATLKEAKSRVEEQETKREEQNERFAKCDKISF